MNRQQIFLITSGILLVCIIYLFGRTVPLKSASAPVGTTSGISIDTILIAARQQLTPRQHAYVTQLEAAVVRGDVKKQQIKVYNQLASFWKDTVHLLLPYSHYLAEAAKLENSEKSLTFAAQFFLKEVRKQENPALKTWIATQAKELFEKSLSINPANDSNKIGLGSCYLFGNISSNPMEGIKLIREVAEKNPENTYAQFTLGYAAIMSGQWDRAIDRLKRVASKEPDNEEVNLLLAEAYERKGDKENAVKWYQSSRELISDPAFIEEIDKRINSLK